MLFWLVFPNTNETVACGCYTVIIGRFLFQRVNWQLTLSLRKRPIQVHHSDIRVTPVFIPNVISDLVLVTSQACTRLEFLAWSYLLQLLGLSVNLWDVERYKGLSHHNFTWLGRCKYVVMALSNKFLPSLHYCHVNEHFSYSDEHGMLLMNASFLHCHRLFFDYSDASVAHRLGEHRLQGEEVPAANPKEMWKSCFCCSAPQPLKICAIADKERMSVESKDPSSLYQTVVQPAARKHGCCSYELGTFHIYKGVLNRNAAGKNIVNIRTQNMDAPLSSGPLPFTYDGIRFQAKKEPLPFGPFVQALFALYSILPAARQFGLITSPMYINSMNIVLRVPESPKKPPTKQITLSFHEMTSYVMCWSVYQDLDSVKGPAYKFPGCEKLIALLELEPVKPFATIIYTALQHQADQWWWKGFPWCCCSDHSKKSRL